MRHRIPLTIAAAALALAASAVPSWSQGASSQGASEPYGERAEVYTASTVPSKEVELAFDNPGKVAGVEVRSGDRVEVGQVLMRQDDRAEQAQRERLLAEADVAARVEIAEKRRDLARKQADRLEQRVDTGSANVTEFEEKVLEAEIAQTQIGEEQRQGRAAEASVRVLQVQIDQKTLSSPIDGIVQEVEADAGEIYGPQTPALKIVAIDPLEVESLLIPNHVAAGLRVGDTAEVRFPGDDAFRQAEVVFIDPVADKTSNTRRVRFEVPNPDRRPAGENVEVRLPQ